MKTQRRQLTTGEVARMCGFSPSAVLHWIRSGKLGAFSSPGRQHRIDPHELHRFLKDHAMEVPAELAERTQSRILVVAETPRECHEIEQMLRRSSLACRVETATDGVSACVRVPQLRPDLIVLDLLLPEFDGTEMCRAVRACAEFSGTRILVVTPDPGHPRLQAALDAGADGWILKPVAFADFITRVRSVLGLLRVPVPNPSPALPQHQETAG